MTRLWLNQASKVSIKQLTIRHLQHMRGGGRCARLRHSFGERSRKRTESLSSSPFLVLEVSALKIRLQGPSPPSLSGTRPNENSIAEPCLAPPM